jgi:D-beta-D-heptose 7-phosphate kinase/D-beta-D-heptose 1-phosphate adenosyltransferase
MTLDIATLETLLERVAGLRLVTVGDVMIDRFIYGEVHRISPESPIPILVRTHETVMLGGCANVARNVASLGGRSTLVGIIGDDGPGGEARALVSLEADIEDRLIADPGRPTTQKSRFVSTGQQLLRVDEEVASPVSEAVEQALIEAIIGASVGAGAILLSDYGKGVVTAGIISACLAAAQSTGAALVVDSKARGFAHYGAVDVVKPNAAELARATDLPTDTDADVEVALARALAMSEARAILVTRAAKGMSLAVRGEPVRHYGRPAPEVFDTSGAGDTALAALGLALGAGAPIDQAAQMALIASRVVVQKAGTATATPEDLIEAEAVLERTPLDAKIASGSRMVQVARRWREKGLRVGFTNGCFDILHPGHIAYLAQARAWCDRLIVGLNSDDSIRRLKGDGRPINGVEARGRVLAGLAAVDLVTPFDEDTPLKLIEAARPDLLVKGGDYSLEGVVGHDLVKGWGGEVKLATFLDGHSTTDTLKRLKGQDRQP